MVHVNQTNPAFTATEETVFSFIAMDKLCTEVPLNWYILIKSAPHMYTRFISKRACRICSAFLYLFILDFRQNNKARTHTKVMKTLQLIIIRYLPSLK